MCASTLALIAILFAAARARPFGTVRSDARVGRQAEGYYLLPTNQLLRPWGDWTPIPGRPVDLALDSTRRRLGILNSTSVLLLDARSGAQLGTVASHTTSYAGVAFRPGHRELWASETAKTTRSGGSDGILVIRFSEKGVPLGTDRIPFRDHAVPIGIAFSPDGSTAYVALSRHNTVAVIDARSKRIEREIPVGVAPFAVELSTRSRLLVSNRGGRHPGPGDTAALSSGSKVATDVRTGSSVSGTLSVIDLESSKIREVPVGLAPSGLALSPDEKTLAVANAHSDSITFVDLATMARADVPVPGPGGAFGSVPSAVAFSPDGGIVYAACGGTNAVAVLTRGSAGWKLSGFVPTGWFPAALGVGADGTVLVLSIKGVGNTANGKGSFQATAYEGGLLRFRPPEPVQLAAASAEFHEANTPKFADAAGAHDLGSLGIRYVFLIIKENRTYDQVFGDIAKGNGDPSLVMYGREVTPNHHALAEDYVLFDNYYATSAVSIDGHQWLMQGFVSDYVERAFAAWPRGYAWEMRDALTISPQGFFWQAGPEALQVRIYGEFCLPARRDADGDLVEMEERDLLPWSAYWRMYQEHNWERSVASSSGVPALQHLVSTRYPSDYTSIPDQIRADAFLAELAEREKSGNMPNVSIITLTADHTNGTQYGSPTPRAMVADDDLALGRIVEGISRSRFWPASLILAVEDDAQDGVDHVDGHRTIAFAIGPHVRRGVVDSNHYNHLSLIRTIQEIFGIPPRTGFLQSARPMNSAFSENADLKPYKCLPARIRLDEMNPPENALSGRRLWAARKSREIDWRDVDEAPSEVLNRILWWDSKGYEKPYPK